MEGSDGALLAAIANCDEAAFAAFYRRHLPLVTAFALRGTGNPESAADLVAEVFAAVLLSARRYRDDGPAAPWLLGIARNKLRMSLRRGRIEERARRRLGLEAVTLEDRDVDVVWRLADAGAAELLAVLPEQERAAVEARVLLERDYREIAAELRCSELVVRKRVSRGLARLRETLEGR
jgi:RNA polymerase sigma-70 factor (ECF subfamily)